MAAAVETKPSPTEKFGSEVDRQLAEATSRIRVHDLTLGALCLAAAAAAYATGMILLDKSLNLSEWVRQLSLLGFVAGCAAIAYFLVVRPLRRRINPLYAAAAVEKTIEDPKNSVTGYVEAQESGRVNATVKAAMSARAAKVVGEADVNRAVDHRNLMIVGGILIAFILALTVLFFIFRPSQFSSLAARTFVPFSSDPIATRTQLTLVKPEPPDVTITNGQTITVAVEVGGRVPSKSSPERVRLMIRYHPADPNYEIIPLEEGDTSRNWQLVVPQSRVLNGFWYKVAAGDTETPEYRVNVRSLPRFTDFEATYEYPAYTRRPTDKSKATDANIRAYRGTKITLVAKTNRDVKEGTLRFELPGAATISGAVATGKPDSLVYQFVVTDPTRYRLLMTSTAGEKNSDVFRIDVDSDEAPKVKITKPEEPEITLPANGLLAVDGRVGDDFGIDKVRLRLRFDGRDLAPIYYPNGEDKKDGKDRTSFRREKDNSWPTDVVYKGSADLTKLTFADGQKFEAKEGLQLEYWLEALDNCSTAPPVFGWGKEPQAGNVGSSKPQTLRLSAPKTEEADKNRLDQKKDERKNEEQQHNQQQQQQLDNEKRDPKPQPKDKDGQPPPKKGDAKDTGKGEPDPSSKQDPKNQTGNSGMDNNPPKKDGDMPPPKKDGTPGATDPKSDPTVPPKTDSSTNPKKDPNSDPKKDPPADPKKDPKQPGGMGGMPDTNPKKEPDTKQPQEKTGSGTDPKKDNATPKTGMNDAGTDSKGGMAQAPPPKTKEERKNEEDAKKVQEELNRNKSAEGDAKPDTNAKPGDRAEPAQPKPQPKGGDNADSKPKEAPKSGDPMMMGDKDKNAPAESKPQGAPEKPTAPSEPKPAPKGADPMQPDKKPDQPAERRDEPLGGAPGEDKPEPKTEPKAGGDPKGAPKEPKKDNQDPKSGSTGKPCPDPQAADPNGTPMSTGGTEKPKDPPPEAGQPKPMTEPAPGQDKDPNAKPKSAPAGDTKPQQQPDAGDGKPQQSPERAGTKPAPKKDDPVAGPMGKEPPPSETKPPPQADPMKPNEPNGGASATRPEPPKQPMGGGDAVEPGMERPDPKQEPKGDGKSGATKGKEGDKGGKDAKKPTGGGGTPDSKETTPKQLDPEEQKKLEEAVKNLDSPDPQKQKDARDTLDKAVGEEKRKEIEQLKKDLKSDDKATRDAAQKKIDDLKNPPKKDMGTGMEMGTGVDKGGEPKQKEPGKKLTEEEIAELLKKAGDLNSPDKMKREEAEKAFDDKVGEETRKKIQDQLKPPPPADPKGQEDFKKQIEDLVRRGDRDPVGKRNDIPGTSTEDLGRKHEDDPKNRARAAQLQLEEFEKNRYNRDLQERLGWTQEEMDRFLEGQRRRVEQMAKEAEEAARNPALALAPMPAPAGDPTIKLGGGKVDQRGSGGSGSASGAASAPPGFGDAQSEFLKKLQKR